MQPAATFALLLAAASPAQGPRFAEFDLLMPPTGTRAACTAAADLDGDGQTDLILAGRDQAIEVFLARGNGGRFEATPASLSIAQRPVHMATADFDGDGSTDVFVAAAPSFCLGLGCSSGLDLVLWNDGRGGLDPAVGPQPAVAAGRFSRTASVGDVDGDGDPDVLLAVYPVAWSPCVGCTTRLGPSADVLLINDGSGGLTPSPSQPLTAADSLTESALLVDLDLDGDLDAMISRRLAHGFDAAEDRTYWNDGTGLFAQASVAPMPRPALELHAADLDGDGDRDIVRVDTAGLQVFETTSGGPVRRALAVPAGLGPCRDVRFGDWDGDGNVDLSVCQAGAATPIRLVPLFGIAGGIGFATRIDTTVASWAAHPHPVDIDRDGDDDFVILADSVADHEAWFNDGSGRWRRPPERFANGATSHRDAAVGDFDGDGDLDVAVAARPPSGNVLLTNDGWGDLAPSAAADFTTTIADSAGIAAGDVDGDGDLDLVTANTGGPITAEPARLYTNDGAGRFTARALPVGDTLDVALGDLDGDGDLDLVFTGYAGTAVLINRGASGYDPTAGIASTAVGTTISLVDIDGDGDLDALTTAWAGLGGHLLRNDGTGDLTADPTALPPLTDDTAAHACGDVDGDGDPDLLLANDGGAFATPNRLLRNAGNGTFSSAPYPGDASRTAAVHLVDLDGDGDLDALEVAYETGSSQAPTRVLENDGTGRFRPVPDGTPRAPARAHRYALGDFDRDGDVDGLLLGDGPFHLHANTTRHLSPRDFARLGHTLWIDLHARPGQSAAIAAAPIAATTPIAQGLLGLDPNWAQVLLAGTVPPTGPLSLSLPIPNSPALAGISIYWQGVVGPPDRLTNRLTTRLDPY